MKVIIWSNAPWCATGYGMQAKQLSKRLKADGHEVSVIANYGLSGAPMTTGDGIQVMPQGAHPYSLDIGNAHARLLLGDEPGVIIPLYDTWPLLEAPDLFSDPKWDVWYWAPIDHAPAPPKVIEWCRNHNVIAMSQFGYDMLKAADVEPGYMIWHGIERDLFKPTPSDIRNLMGVPDDAHLCTTVMANIGQAPVRKSWFENLLAWRIFAEKHPDAHLYIHTQLRHPRGVDLVALMRMWQLPEEKVRIVDQGVYAGGMITQEDLAAIYTAADVTLMATAGEGWGVPAAESIACHTPVIGTRFSAQIEVIGDCGWLVPYVTMWDYMQGAAQATPAIDGIVEALEASYTGGKAPFAEKCEAQAARFDADVIYAEKWRPFLADREIKPNRQQRRAQKRRKAA